MKKVFAVIITIFLALSAQTAEQIKKQLKDVGVTSDQAMQMAKDRGMTDQQIESEAQDRGINLDEVGDGSKPQQTTDPQIDPVLDESAVLELPKSETTAEDEINEEKEELALETTGISEREATFHFGLSG